MTLALENIGSKAKLVLQDGEGHVMMSDGIPVPDSSLDTAGVLSASPLLVSDGINGDATIGMPSRFSFKFLDNRS